MLSPLPPTGLLRSCSPLLLPRPHWAGCAPGLSTVLLGPATCLTLYKAERALVSPLCSWCQGSAKHPFVSLALYPPCLAKSTLQAAICSMGCRLLLLALQLLQGRPSWGASHLTFTLQKLEQQLRIAKGPISPPPQQVHAKLPHPSWESTSEGQGTEPGGPGSLSSAETAPKGPGASSVKRG